MNSLLRLKVALLLSLFIINQSTGQVFNNQIPIPYLVYGPDYSIDIGTALHNFDPNSSISNANLNAGLEAYCYNSSDSTSMTYLGPTLVFKRGDVVNFDITNNLPAGVNTTVHWHGLNLPAPADGGPHQVIVNGTTWSPTFPIIDEVQTIWYHTHLMNKTTEQVIRGLAGLIIIEDPNDTLRALLPQEYGVDDIPINIQEKGFVMNDSTTPPTAIAIKAGEKPGNGPYTLINGVIGGVQHVPQGIVRLRVLNGSPRKMYHIGLAPELKGTANYQTMYMFATGGGYLDFPRPVDSTLMSIGDRREFLVDFSSFADGDTIYMRNLPVPSDANYGNTLGSALMAFVVDVGIQPTDPISVIPGQLKPYGLTPGTVDRTREKVLMGQPNPPGNGQIWTIDGIPMSLNVINDTVVVNTKERWVIHNQTTQAHPFHIHKVQFQVIEYSGKVGMSNVDSTYTYPNLPDELIGFKDVQLIRAGATLTFEARFDSFPSPLDPSMGFMYHCHILTHEDTSMMHQFVVVDSADLTTNIKLVEDDDPLYVYPNPAVNEIHIEREGHLNGVIRFYDLSGRLIDSRPVQGINKLEISVQNLPRGAVLMECLFDEKRYFNKLILRPN